MLNFCFGFTTKSSYITPPNTRACNLQDGTACFVTLLETLLLVILNLLVCFSDLFVAILLYVWVVLTLFAPIVMITDPTNQSFVPLVRHVLSNRGSEILIRILPKERTLNVSFELLKSIREIYRVSSQKRHLIFGRYLSLLSWAICLTLQLTISYKRIYIYIVQTPKDLSFP